MQKEGCVPRRGTDWKDDPAGPGTVGQKPPQKGARPMTPGWGASGLQAARGPTCAGLSPQGVALSQAAPEVYDAEDRP